MSRRAVPKATTELRRRRTTARSACEVVANTAVRSAQRAVCLMSGLYMLDTDICAFILRRSSPTLLERIQTVPLRQQSISMITLAGLLYGVEVSSRKKANRAAVDLLVRHLTVIDWSRDAAEHYAQIRADLKKRG